MEKRLFLAIILSILILMSYSALVSRFAPPQPVVQQPLAETMQSSSTNSASFKTTAEVSAPSSPENTILKPSLAKENLTTLSNKDLFLSVNMIGSGIKESKINSYDSSLLQSDIGILVEWQGVEFSKNPARDYISMSYNDSSNGITVSKSYKFTENQYILEMNVEIVNTSNIKRYVKYTLNLGSINEKIRKEHPMDERYIELSISMPDKMLRGNYFGFNPKNANDKIQWVGIRDKYFCSIIKPSQPIGSIIKSTNLGITSYLLEAPALELSPGQKIQHTYSIYIGPQNPDLIAKLGSSAEQIVNFGMFDPLAHMLLGTLRFLYKVSKNWGVAIILFSLLVFVVLSPLSIKSFTSMRKMQELQPIMEELKIKYKDSPQKMHKEILELYREKKINPFGGCLPLLLQMPIFVALYQAMMRFIDLKGAKFLWIKDLSEPDRLFVFKQSLPIVGNELNILPVVMIITMLIQQKMTTANALQTADTAKQQKMMGLFMSVFFGIIFYHMPSGLVLYWAFNSILMLIFQTKIMASKA
ncbi:MAG: membrane protein insertase YidC [Candidatus Omnitrophica bacterium]|nr:membrane protein insertase YidC [Candidatus Omnitrophota bacterium]